MRGRCGKAVAEGKRGLRRNGCGRCGRRGYRWRFKASDLRSYGSNAGCEACRRARDMRIKTAAVELRIWARCENVGINRPGATEHKRGRRRACDEDLRACCSGWCPTLGCRETDRRNSTGTHPHRIQTGPHPRSPHGRRSVKCTPQARRTAATARSSAEFQRTVSQRHKPALRRLLVKCGLSAGSCEAVPFWYGISRLKHRHRGENRRDSFGINA